MSCDLKNEIENVLDVMGIQPVGIIDGDVVGDNLRFGASSMSIPGLGGVINDAVRRKGQIRDYLLADLNNETIYQMSPRGEIVTQFPLASVDLLTKSGNASPVTVGENVIGQWGRIKPTTNKTTKLNSSIGTRYDKGGLNLPPELKKFRGSVYMFSENTKVVNDPTNIYQGHNVVSASDMAKQVGLGSLDNESADQVRALSGKTIGDVLPIFEEYAAKTGNDFYADTLKVLINTTKGSRVPLTDIRFDVVPDDGGRYSGRYIYSNKGNPERIILSDVPDGISLHTLTHEMTHAATASLLDITQDNDGKLLTKSGRKFTRNKTARSRRIIQEINNLYFQAQQIIDLENQYGLTNEAEFVAELFTNPEFRAQLNNHNDITEDGDVSLIDTVIGGLLKGLNLSRSTTDTFDQKLTLLFSDARDREMWQETNFFNQSEFSMLDKVDSVEKNDYGTESLLGTIRTKYFSARALQWARFRATEFLYNSQAAFDRYLINETNLIDPNGEYDDALAIQHLRTSKEKQAAIIKQFQINQGRKVKVAHNEVTQLVRRNNLNDSEIFHYASLYTTVSHVPHAVRVARKKLQDRVKYLEYDVAIEEQEAAIAYAQAKIKAKADGKKVPKKPRVSALKKTLNGKLLAAKQKLTKFDNEQAGGRGGLVKNPSTGEHSIRPFRIREGSQAGLTERSAQEVKEFILDRLTDVTGLSDTRRAALRLDVERQLQSLDDTYQQAFNDINEFLVDNGEIEQTQLDAWRKLYGTEFDADGNATAWHYVPFTGRNTHDAADDLHDDAFGYGDGHLDLGVNHQRIGRQSAPDDAYVAFQNMINTTAIRVATRDFRKEMYDRIRAGDIPGGHILTDHYSAEVINDDGVRVGRAPQGIKPVKISVDGIKYEWYIDNIEVMTSLRDAKRILEWSWLDKYGHHVTRRLSSLLTRYNPLFAPKNSQNDMNERITHIVNRSVKDRDGKVISSMGFRFRAHKNSIDPKTFADVATVLYRRILSNKPIENEMEGIGRGGKMFLELERLGGVSSFTDYIDRSAIASSSNDRKRSAVDAEIERKTLQYFEQLARGEVEPSFKVFADTVKASTTGIADIMRFWNMLFDVRASVAVYETMVDMNVDNQEAAYRALDVMNFNMEGRVTKVLSNLFFFSVPTIASKANVFRDIRNMAPTRTNLRTGRFGRAWGQMTFLFTTANLLRAMIGMIAFLSMSDEDEELLGAGANPIDVMSPVSKANTAPLIINDETVIRIPISFGANRIMWKLADMLQSGINDPFDQRNQSSGGDLMRTIYTEVSPFADTRFDFTDNVGGGLIDAFTPSALKPIVQVATNRTSFGPAIDSPYNQGNDFTAGSVTVPEDYKQIAAKLQKLGTWIDMNPRSIQTLMEGYGIGALSAVARSVSNSELDKQVKGKEITNVRDELGLWDMVGVSTFYGKNKAYEEGLWYGDKQTLQRDKNSLFVTRRRPKRLKDGTISKTSIETYDVPRSNADPLDIKIYEMRQALYDEYNKADDIGVDKLTKKYKQQWTQILENAYKRNRDNPEKAYLTEIELLQTNERPMKKIREKQLSQMRKYLKEKRKLEQRIGLMK